MAPRDAAGEATPRPWSLSPCSQGGAILLRGADLPLSQRHPQSHLQVVPAADAEFIVRAVNAHDALVAVVRQYMEVCSGEVIDSYGACAPCDCALCDEARAALALAEGDPPVEGAR